MAVGSAIPGILSALLLVGCQSVADVEDTGFRVVSVMPTDGDNYVLESSSPELRVSGNASEQTCTTESVRLVLVTDGNTVATSPTYSISFPDNGAKIKLEMEDGLLPGYWYMFTVRSGSWGCTSTAGNVIKPFASVFFVPE